MQKQEPGNTSEKAGCLLKDMAGGSFKLKELLASECSLGILANMSSVQTSPLACMPLSKSEYDGTCSRSAV